MKKYEITWEGPDGFAAGLGLNDIVEGESAEDVLDAAEYYYFLSRDENCEDKHVCIVTEITD